MAKKKPSKRAIVKKLDRILSLYIRKRDGYCVVCGSGEYLQCGHYFSRVFYNTRWDFRNCNAQCAKCNRSHEYDPEPYRAAMVELYGEQVLQELSSLAHSGRKLSFQDLEEIEAEIKRRENLL